jgi:hypothetical protein
MLYTYKGRYPESIPFRIKLPDGRTRTDPLTFSPEELLSCGYIPVPNKPEVESSKIVEWSTQNFQWIIRDKTIEELEYEKNNTKENLIQKVNKHRNFLLSNGFEFEGMMFDSKDEDRKRISATALLASLAITNGAEKNDFFWHGEEEPFGWISQNNIVILMDAHDMLEFAKTALSHERNIIMSARKLKDMEEIPVDFANGQYWAV